LKLESQKSDREIFHFKKSNDVDTKEEHPAEISNIFVASENMDYIHINRAWKNKKVNL
jgi:hypothetical protein